MILPELALSMTEGVEMTGTFTWRLGAIDFVEVVLSISSILQAFV